MSSPTFELLDTIWTRPTLVVLSEDEPIIETQDIGGSLLKTGKVDLGENYIYLTDDGRSPLRVQYERIEYKKRMINGRMRSYHVADKRSFSTSWEDLPSRSKSDIYANGVKTGTKGYISEYERGSTSTGSFAAGQEMLDWYKQNTSDFWMTLVYDIDTDQARFGSEEMKRTFEVVNVMFDSFDYTVEKRGQMTDLWSVEMALSEV